MTALIGWMARAMQDGDAPSSKRVTFVAGLLGAAPTLLLIALFKLTPDAWAICFGAWVASVAGGYAFTMKNPPAAP